MAMLKRDEFSAVPTNSGDLNALLGRGSEFEGKLTFEGTVRIDGKFTGTIVTNDVLVVGEGAKVNAEVSCGTIIVHGEVNGNVKAKIAVELHHPARMRGNVETPSLMVEKGVIFEGQTKMEGVEKAPVAKPIPSPSPIQALKPT
jgi:cytoskeletal protein CcmA (bactofilin family)